MAYGVGKARQICKNELEKLPFATLTCAEALPRLVQIIDICHNEWKDKPYLIELSMVSEETNRIHKVLEKEKTEEIIAAARQEKMQE